MQTTEALISFSLLVLNGALITGLLIPLATKLTEIRDSFTRFKLPFVPEAGVRRHEILEAENEQRPKRMELQDGLNTYSLLSWALRILIELLVLAVALTVLTILLCDLFQPAGRLIGLANAFSQLFIFGVAVRTRAPAPDKLSQVPYLIQHLEISPHSLFSAMKLEVLIQYVGQSPQSRDNPLEIALTSELRVGGYRIAAFLASEDEKRLFWFCGGIIAGRSRIVRNIVKPDEFGVWDQCTITLGEFPFNLVVEKNLQFRIYVFVPLWNMKAEHPLYGFGRISRISDDGVMMGHSGGMFEVRYERKDVDVFYDSMGTHISNCRVTGDSIHHKALVRFWDYIELSNKLVQLTDLQGTLLDNEATSLQETTSQEDNL